MPEGVREVIFEVEEQMLKVRMWIVVRIIQKGRRRGLRILGGVSFRFDGVCAFALEENVVNELT